MGLIWLDLLQIEQQGDMQVQWRCKEFPEVVV